MTRCHRYEGHALSVSGLKVSYLKGELSCAMWDRTTATIRVLSDEEACLAENSLHTLSLQILISCPGIH